jgi:predicted phosphodiesterase
MQIINKKSPISSVGFLTDFHSPNFNEEVVNIAIDTFKSKGCKTVVLSELPENRSVSYWSKNDGSLEHEMQVARQLVAQISQRLKRKQIIYLPGNHDERLERYLAENARALCDLRGLNIYEQTDMKKHGWEYHDNKLYMRVGKGPLRIGKLSYIHGHEVKAGWGSVNIAKIYYDRCRTNVILGHHHRCEEKIMRTITNHHEGAWCVGCCCELNPEFMPHNDWVHGFAVISYYDDGFFKVENMKIIGGRVL